MYIRRDKRSPAETLRIDLGLVIKKNCTKLESVVLESRQMSFLSWKYLTHSSIISWPVSGSGAGIG